MVASAKTFKASAAAARYLAPTVPREERLRAARGEAALPPGDLVLVVFFLCHDADPEIKKSAMATLRGLGVDLLSRALADPALHPRAVDVLARLHHAKPELATLFAEHPNLSGETMSFLVEKGVFSGGSQSAAAEGAGAGGADAAPPEGAELPDEAVVDEESEEFRSKYQQSQTMGVSQKIKTALTGDKEWRTILIKDANKLVSGSVVKNPRISEPEVLAICKSSVQNDEIMRVICSNKEWLKNYQIRRALVLNHKTPLPAALRLLASLSEKDVAAVAKSKNVSTVIATQARRVLMSKKEK